MSYRGKIGEMYGLWPDHDDSFAAVSAPSTTASIAPAPAQQAQGQWGQDETKALIRIRADMERHSPAPSKALWEGVSAQMLAGGFARTPEQCKCKWKNLLNRYKGKETSDPAYGRECPFFDELHALFTQRSRNMQRLLMESETGSKKKAQRSDAGQSSDEFLDESDEEAPAQIKRQKRKAEASVPEKQSKSGNGVRETLEQLLLQQIRMEKQWMEMAERHSNEQALFEQEWRLAMEKLERERLMAEKAWREREEQRLAREESRAERRDALLTALLNSLIDDHSA